MTELRVPLERRGGLPTAGDLVLVAEPDAWFQYYWWDDRADAPPDATEMDIYAKPGFDPCELFFGAGGEGARLARPLAGQHLSRPHRRVGLRLFRPRGPAAPTLEGDGPVDATDVTPTLAALLGLEGTLSMEFDGASLRDSVE